MPKIERRKFVFGIRQLDATIELAIILSLFAMVQQAAQAQTFSVLHMFTGGSDGAAPRSGLIFDPAGNLYGTTAGGGIWHGQPAAGVVFKLDPNDVETVLTTFSGGGAAGPVGTLVLDSSVNLYGTTENTGTNGGGIVFKVFPAGGRTALHIFGKGGAGDGTHPVAGVILDKKGNLYGTTTLGGTAGFGVVFKLHIRSREETILHTFTGKGGDGTIPTGGLVRDSTGRLYGTASAGGTYSGVCASIAGCGIVFRMGSMGNETVLHRFKGGADGIGPRGDLVRDGAGNLYGTTLFGGAGECQYSPYTGCGTVFKVDGTGKETVLYSFMGGTDGALPAAGLVRDSAGNFYGTTSQGGGTGCAPLMGCGTAFKLDATGKETVLYTFSGGTDGASPFASLLLDAAGNLYGTTAAGGTKNKNVCASSGCGVVFKITP